MKIIKIKPSKSYAQRAILYALFSGIDTQLENIFPLCDDTKAALDFVEKCSKYDIENDRVCLSTCYLNLPKIINVGESGTLCRMLVPILSYYNYKKLKITGSGSLLKRSLDMDPTMKEVFDSMYNIYINTENGHLPIHIDCTKKNDAEVISQIKEYTFNGKDTSQYISGFIMMLVLMGVEDVTININDCDSINYVLLTVDVLKQFGTKIQVNNDNANFYKIIIIDSHKPAFVSLHIDGDWSGAAAVMIYHLLFSGFDEISYQNICFEKSVQPDKQILYLISKFADVYYECNCVDIKRNVQVLHPFEFDCKTCPDLFPVVCALAATISGGWSKIHGLSRLTNKESDRGKVIYEEFLKYGINVEIHDDYIMICGVDRVVDPGYNSHNDHRIAMALTILRKWYGLSIPEKDDCLNKSYSTFLEDTVYGD